MTANYSKSRMKQEEKYFLVRRLYGIISSVRIYLYIQVQCVVDACYVSTAEIGPYSN